MIVQVDCGGGVSKELRVEALRAGGSVRQTIRAGNKTRPAEVVVDELSISGKVVLTLRVRLDRQIFVYEKLTPRDGAVVPKLAEKLATTSDALAGAMPKPQLGLGLGAVGGEESA